jgi:hypothetical protein
LAQALAENASIQALAQEGLDFRRECAEREIAREQAVKAAAAADVTFQALCEAWLLDGVSRSDGNAELRRSFEKDLMPSLASLRARDVGDAELRNVLRRVGRERGSARTADRLLSDVNQMYRWSLRRPQWRAVLVQGNPAELVQLKEIAPYGYVPTIRQRTLLLPRFESCGRSAATSTLPTPRRKTGVAVPADSRWRLNAPCGSAWQRAVVSASS